MSREDPHAGGAPPTAATYTAITGRTPPPEEEDSPGHSGGRGLLDFSRNADVPLPDRTGFNFDKAGVSGNGQAQRGTALSAADSPSKNEQASDARPLSASESRRAPASVPPQRENTEASDSSFAPAGEAAGEAGESAASLDQNPPSQAEEATGTSSSASESPWVSYMAGTSKSELIERLRKNSSLRDSLRQKLEDLRAQGDGSGMVELLQEALAEAEREDRLPLKDLKPVSAKEMFSMDSEGTDAQIRDLLSELEGSASRISADTSLFDRNSFALRRSQVRGAVKGPK